MPPFSARHLPKSPLPLSLLVFVSPRLGASRVHLLQSSCSTHDCSRSAWQRSPSPLGPSAVCAISSPRPRSRRAAAPSRPRSSSRRASLSRAPLSLLPLTSPPPPLDGRPRPPSPSTSPSPSPTASTTLNLQHAVVDGHPRPVPRGAVRPEERAARAQADAAGRGQGRRCVPLPPSPPPLSFPCSRLTLTQLSSSRRVRHQGPPLRPPLDVRPPPSLLLSDSAHRELTLLDLLRPRAATRCSSTTCSPTCATR